MTDNIVSHIPRVYTETLTSPKTGKPYTILNVIFSRPNGKAYTYKGFLNEEQKALIEDSVPLEGSSNL